MDNAQSSAKATSGSLDHLEWFAASAFATRSAESSAALLLVATEAISGLTGSTVITCWNAADRERYQQDAQILPVLEGIHGDSICLAIFDSMASATHLEAAGAFITYLEPSLRHMREREQHERHANQESVIADLLELLMTRSPDHDRDCQVRCLAQRVLSAESVEVAISSRELPEALSDEDPDDLAFARRFATIVDSLHDAHGTIGTVSGDTANLDALSEVTLAAASTHDSRQLFMAVSKALSKVVPIDAMLISMIPAGEDDAVTVFRIDRGIPSFERAELSPAFQMAMKLGRPFIVDDLPDALYSSQHSFGDPERRVHSLAGAPLVANETVSGLLVVENYEPGAYQIEHANLLLDIGRSIATALERADLLDRLRARSVRENALRTVVERLTTTLDTRELLKIAVAETAPILSHSLMAAISFDASSTMTVNHIAAHGEDRVMDVVGINAHSKLNPGGIAAHACASRTVEIHTNPHRSVVALPLLAETGCIGVFVIARQGADAFSDEDLSLLDTLGGTLASALRISQLYTNRSQHERDLIEVQRVSRLVLSSLNPDSILNEIITSLPRMFDAEGCSVRIVEGEFLVPLAEYGEIVRTFAPKVPMATSLAGTIIRDKKVLAVDDLHTHPETRETALGSGITVRGWLGAPMIDAGGEAIGNLSIHSDQPRQWTDRDKVLLQTLAGSTALAIQNAWRFERTRDVLLASIESLATAVDAKDPTTLNHSRNVAEYARRIARGMNCSEEQTEQIALAGLLHDVGKIGIPDRILQKPDNLDRTEWKQMKTHAAIGEQILSGNPHLSPILPLVRHHHERWDGQGYPDKLEGTAIPLGAAVVGLADAIDTMATNRPYRQALHWEDVCKEIKACSGRQFHPEAARVFLELARQGQIEPLTTGRSDADSATVTLASVRDHSLDARALMIFHGVAREVRALTDLNTFIANTSSVIQDVLEVTEVGIFLVESNADAMVFRASPAQRLKGMSDVGRQLGEGVVGWVIEHATPLTIPDVTLDSRFIGRPGSTTRSELAVPLIADGDVIGAINVESERVAAFSDTDIRLLTTTADHIAQTIQVARLHNRFKQLAATDALTGLANHRSFYERLDEEIRHASLTDGVLTVAIMDVDQLKTINDTYGHLIGDEALREIARVLMERCRRSDFVCRYGGDEFALILTDTDLEGANRAIAHIVAGISAASFSSDLHRLPLPTGAWGMSTFPDDGVRASELVRVADMRMYSHKHSARSHQYNTRV